MSVQRSREALPDALRALAMVSVLTVNALGYAGAPWGPALGSPTPPDSAWPPVVQGLVAGLLQAKGYTTLAFVFGMSLWLAARGRPRTEALQRGRVRNSRLLHLGILHGAFVYFGDILTLYALVGRQWLGRLHMPWRRFRRHLWHALAWAVLAKLALAVLILMPPHTTADTSLPSFSTVQDRWQYLSLNASTYAATQVVAIVVGGPVMYLCMALGVAAARLRLLTHRRWRPLLWRAVARGAPPLLVVTVACAVGNALTAPADALHPWLHVLTDVSALPVAACGIALLALAAAGGSARWCHALAPLGQRTLSLYVGHSVVCLVLLSGVGWALPLSTLQTVALCLGLWLLALVAARLSGSTRWPLEAWMGRR